MKTSWIEWRRRDFYGIGVEQEAVLLMHCLYLVKMLTIVIFVVETRNVFGFVLPERFGFEIVTGEAWYFHSITVLALYYADNLVKSQKPSHI